MNDIPHSTQTNTTYAFISYDARDRRWVEQVLVPAVKSSLGSLPDAEPKEICQAREGRGADGRGTGRS